jgi:hypothetical protein
MSVYNFASRVHDIMEAHPHMTMHEAIDRLINWPNIEDKTYYTDNELVARVHRYREFHEDSTPKG